MSHDDPAAGKGRSVERRKVSFTTTLEDLEGRVLLSAVRQLPPNLAMVRHMNRPNPNVQLNARAERLQLMANARAERLQLMANARASDWRMLTGTSRSRAGFRR